MHTCRVNFELLLTRFSHVTVKIYEKSLENVESAPVGQVVLMWMNPCESLVMS